MILFQVSNLNVKQKIPDVSTSGIFCFIACE